ncbi:sulfotransferase family protein [Rhodovulum bhavnagarense]|uniref:Sulfotransferase family protein n=1 Tax=Rhodovulum bhavnagarense TaxID=992286 RepID=A0A4R2RU26_9RHOB|nr:sulfotransferase [Rhodovulum bhavnagarense]TCP63421.1 sulfotransferase family protein [Rhodovulum bhavnagarense]
MADLQPLFILTCMRSYSSLVSSMLGQHSGLFAMPELNPFIGDSLRQIETMARAVRPRTLDGLYRAVAELVFGGQGEPEIAEARRWCAARPRWTAVELISDLSDRVAPRKPIDKSPSTVLVDGALERALAQFPNAFFLHLYRHPIATTASIAKITGKWQPPTRQGLRGGRQRDPEESWFGINAAILRASLRIAPGHFMSVRGEDVLRDPDRYLTQICDWMGLETTRADLSAMHHPEHSPFACLGPPSAPFGNDPNFLREPGYNPRPISEAPLDAPLEWDSPNRRLGRETVALACQLGYGRGTR